MVLTPTERSPSWDAWLSGTSSQPVVCLMASLEHLCERWGSYSVLSSLPVTSCGSCFWFLGDLCLTQQHEHFLLNFILSHSSQPLLRPVSHCWGHVTWTPTSSKMDFINENCFKNKTKALGAQLSFHFLFMQLSVEPNFPSVHLPINRHTSFLLKLHGFARCVMVHVCVVYAYARCVMVYVCVV